ncbi:hypothetical protein DL764_007329 [Monosporascus ibericus]|uniref:Uncharacterized protein n=1 Tax=Monosporascus ibericus TaxID=155417 RepID=A0A4Q4T218_9PEZI|nr:hypothetical protein DL764_007329 [Monosporascus ibericus]
MRELLADQETGSFEVWKLDMPSYNCIRSFVERTNVLDRQDIVILGAGITRQSFQLNPSTGHEENGQINYLSIGQLTILYSLS